MHITMVKKRLANGETCRKCAQAEELLRSRGLWDRIDEVVWADESDPASAGMQLGARFGVSLAPFFVVTDKGEAPVAYESVLKLIQERLAPARVAVEADDAADFERAGRELADRAPWEICVGGLSDGALLSASHSAARRTSCSFTWRARWGCHFPFFAWTRGVCTPKPTALSM